MRERSFKHSPIRDSGQAPAGPTRANRIRAALDDAPRVERLSRMFRALGDPTRSKMVFALSHEDLCVSEIAEVLGASLSATSHQLRILRDLEIVRVRRHGRSQVYALNEQAFGFCSPRSCHAWRQIETNPLLALESRRPRDPRRGRPARSRT